MTQKKIKIEVWRESSSSVAVKVSLKSCDWNKFTEEFSGEIVLEIKLQADTFLSLKNETLEKRFWICFRSETDIKAKGTRGEMVYIHCECITHKMSVVLLSLCWSRFVWKNRHEQSVLLLTLTNCTFFREV